MSGESAFLDRRFLRPKTKNRCGRESLSNGLAEVRCGRREWEDFYRSRWRYDKKVRTTHGVNCTGSCSWDVYVKNGLVVWEVPATDYPGCGAASPDHEPRGCPRGASFSWYTYSPVRLKYPYIRSELLDMWRRALEEGPDPVTAWQLIVDDPEKAKTYQQVRGKGGLVRVSWDQATTPVAASLVQTIKQYGPDRIFGFTPIPAMSMVCYASGARFLSLIGASMISFYDWYADLPPASPQIWGEQTDVPESADWFEAAYMIVWGTNLPLTRTPDAHFYTEARYRSTKVTAVAPDYAEYCKFADTWLPSYPQFDENPLETCRQAEADGAESDEAIIAFVEDRIKNGDLRFAIEDPDHPNNFPRVPFLWRANLLGASGKGHEYFLKHLLGVESAVSSPESTSRPDQIRWREPAPEGKLDLLVTSEMRMSTSALYSDVVLPAASWYEMQDLSTTDMHPFIHPFNPAIDPPWDTSSNWDQFKAIAEKFSSLAEEHLGRKKDLVATPLAHDTPGEIAQPRVRDWKSEDSEPAAGRNLPHLAVAERNYPNVCAMMTALGSLAARDGMGAKGVSWKADQEYELLKQELGTVAVPGVSQSLPRLHDGRDVASAILGLAPETNGATAVKSWQSLEKVSGLKLSHLSRDREGERMTFAEITAQPWEIMTSPTWSGMESKERRYSPFVINIEQKLPFRTLTGRAQFYMDHEWMLAFGENLLLYRPPLDMQALSSTGISREPGQEIILNYLTPHSKWSIHCTYSDTLAMLTLFRGGEAIWINNEDARSIEVRDNDWLECFNVNGVVTARAVVSHRIPRGKAFMYHAQERLITTPGSKRSGQRGGTHNSVTRILLKPTHMIGGYAQFSYFFNYYGSTGTQCDEVIVVRKAGEIDWYED